MLTTKSLFSAEGLDDRSLEFLVNAIEQNNLPGFDYFEFKRAVVNLQEMQLEESIAYKSAFTTAATVGLTKDKLVETANYYRNLLLKEKDQFETALSAQHANKIHAREADVKRLQDQIERHKAEVSRLQDEIGGYLNEVEAAQTQMSVDAEKLDKARSNFDKAHQAVLLHIDRDVENIHKYL
jgi:flagellin-like hook-associated protein FlgL